MTLFADAGEDRRAFLQETGAALAALYDGLSALDALELDALDPASAALVVVDMVRGFAVEGAMSSPRVGAMAEPIGTLVRRCRAAGMAVLAFADAHDPDSLELASYPPHCLRGTPEAALCDEIAVAGAADLPGEFIVVDKNSTNGAVEPAFKAWRKAHRHIDTYVVTGDCTDICVIQFAMTAKTWANAHNRPLRVIVPLALVDTFDAGPAHSAALMNAVALAAMEAGGIELRSAII